jgi:hypothetical protein
VADRVFAVLSCDVCLKSCPPPPMVPGPEGLKPADIAEGWQEFLLNGVGPDGKRRYANSRVLACRRCKKRVQRGEGPIRTWNGGQDTEPQWIDPA